jgi:hypothetical protein
MVTEFKRNKKTGGVRFKHAEVIEKDGPGTDSGDTDKDLSEMDKI